MASVCAWAFVFLVGIGAVSAQYSCTNLPPANFGFTSSVFSGLVQRSDLCFANYTCTRCLRIDSFEDGLADFQVLVSNWLKFLTENNCWGQPLRENASMPVFTVGITKRQWLPSLIYAGCDASAAFPVTCPPAPTCPPTPTCPPEPTRPPNRDSCAVADQQYKGAAIGLSVTLGVVGSICLCFCLGQGYERCCKGGPDDDEPPKRSSSTLSSIKLDRRATSQPSSPTKSLDQIVKERAKANRSRTPR